nr:MAG TPA: hypothetical protein [Caudoviricetes sp.]
MEPRRPKLVRLVVGIYDRYIIYLCYVRLPS